MLLIPIVPPQIAPLPPSSRLQTPLTEVASLRPRRARKSTSAASSSSQLASTPSESTSASSSTRSSPVPPNAPSFSSLTQAAERDLARVWEAVSDSRRIVVVCGAGISVSAPASIPDFRSSTGLFRSLKEQHPDAGLSSGKDLFDARLFSSESNTSLFYSMIASLHGMSAAAQPTLFHHFLKRLDEQGRLQRVYTQNIDALEEKAGLTFGLGEGARRTFQRTASLGKRKRILGAVEATEPVHSSSEAADSSSSAASTPRKRSPWSKVHSAPAVSLSSPARSLPSSLLTGPSPEPETAMFPRVIPLHGSLSNLVCTACDFKMPTLSEATAQVNDAMKSLEAGEAPECPSCSERDAVRIAAGLRSRGIGFLKPDVVLYNGPNKSGERVGECLERDVLGLRDRFDGAVPETFTEENLRLKREEKETAKGNAHSSATQSIDGANALSSSSNQGHDILGELFEADEEEENETGREFLPLSSDLNSKPPTVPGSRGSMKRSHTQPAKKSPGASSTGKKGKVLKPLPPDLLIVAGTSLKVPGTKRVVREFAKATHARDGIVPKGCKSRLRGGSNSRESSKTPSRDADSVDSDGESGDEAETGEVEDGSNSRRPIRTILLNYDFPIPAKEWEGVFDVWVQGDVQTAAAGLWRASTGYGMGPALDGEDAEDIPGVSSWSVGMDELDDAREALDLADKVAQTAKSAVVKEEDITENSQSASAKSNGRKASASAPRKPRASTTAASSDAVQQGAGLSRRKSTNGPAKKESEDVKKASSGVTRRQSLSNSNRGNKASSAAQPQSSKGQATMDTIFKPEKKRNGAVAATNSKKGGLKRSNSRGAAAAAS